MSGFINEGCSQKHSRERGYQASLDNWALRRIIIESERTGQLASSEMARALILNLAIHPSLQRQKGTWDQWLLVLSQRRSYPQRREEAVRSDCRRGHKPWHLRTSKCTLAFRTVLDCISTCIAARSTYSRTVPHIPWCISAAHIRSCRQGNRRARSGS